MDRVATELVRLGYTVTPKSLYRDGYTGNHVAIGKAELVYRIEQDDETVIIPWYQGRAGGGGSLRNSFAEFEWFLGFIAQPQFRLKRVRGMIRAAQPQADGRPGLPTARIAEFYKRILGGKTLAWDGGEEWLYLDLKDYRPRRRKLLEPFQSTQARPASS